MSVVGSQGATGSSGLPRTGGESVRLTDRIASGMMVVSAACKGLAVRSGQGSLPLLDAREVGAIPAPREYTGDVPPWVQ